MKSPTQVKDYNHRELLVFIWRSMRPQKWIFAVAFFTSFAWALDALLWPYIIHLVIDVFTVYEHSRKEALENLYGPIVSGISLAVGMELLYRTSGFLQSKAFPRLEASIRMKFFNHIQHHSPHYFNERFAGSLANKITDMTTHVTTLLQLLLFPILPSISACVLGAVLLWYINPIFAYLLLFGIIFFLTGYLVLAKTSSLYQNRHGEARSFLIGKIVDSLSNNFSVNLFYRFKREASYLEPFQKEEIKKYSQAGSYSEKLNCFFSIFYILIIILGLYGAMIYLWIENKISTGQVIQVFTTGWSLVMILWGVGANIPKLFQSLGILKQAYSVFSEPQDILDIPQAKPLILSSGEIRFDHVFFSYGEKEVFKNVSIHLQGGEKVGIVGYTGAGKSTFINLILRFHTPKQGKISIDGQNIAEATLESLRHHIALIPQDLTLFHRTLYENILCGNPEAREEEVILASKKAHCHEFISKIPHGYQATVGERGTKLSGGEKQRIAIARAILANAPILILDEATSSLDSLTETYIQDSLTTFMQNRTTLVIAHRLSTLSHLDRILVFDQGEIAEEGSHLALLQKKGLYAQMWNKQVNGFLPER